MTGYKNGRVGNELVALWSSGIYIAPYFDTSMVSTIAVEVRRIKRKKRTESLKDGRTGIYRKREIEHVPLYNGIRHLDALTPPKVLCDLVTPPLLQVLCDLAKINS